MVLVGFDMLNEHGQCQMRNANRRVFQLETVGRHLRCGRAPSREKSPIDMRISTVVPNHSRVNAATRRVDGRQDSCEAELTAKQPNQ
jgi:hypothetical protein